MKSEKSFTLIELLLVLGVLAVLATIVILVLNPLELLRQARDTQRMADLATINKALAVYQSSGQTSLGSANKIYISVPANQTNCSDLGLPALPGVWTYACVPSSTLQKADGTGWIPLSFSSVSFGTPLEKLPIDPVNTTSSGNYYTYVPGGSWKLTSLFESDKYAKEMNSDGGPDTSIYEIGTDLSLANFQRNLVGYWKFDDGGSTALDSSGNSNDLTWGGTGTHYASGKVGNYAGQFNIATSDYLTRGSRLTNGWSSTTYGAWINPSASVPDMNIMNEWSGGANFAAVISSSKTNIYFVNGGVGWKNGLGSSLTGSWHMFYVVFDGSSVILYIDGQAIYSTPSSGTIGTANYNFKIGANENGSGVFGSFFTGLIDDARIYNRGLSASEIRSIYNATK